uniref:Uncharacterized protein n=1 Tax=Solanum tuberosum TaxID=4113 RepID=M1C5M4_SOLTU
MTEFHNKFKLGSWGPKLGLKEYTTFAEYRSLYGHPIKLERYRQDQHVPCLC